MKSIFLTLVCGLALDLTSAAAQVDERPGVVLQQLYSQPANRSQSMLRIQSADLSLASARLQLDRARELLDRDLISAQEFEERELAFQRALIDYGEVVVATVGGESHIVIERAIKRRAEGGGSEVGLDLTYVAASLPAGVQAPPAIADIVGAPLENVFVSLEAGGTVVSDPYESRIHTFAPGRTKRLSLRLLRDCDEVVVKLRYGGRTEQRPIILLRDEADGTVVVDCPQFSQEADLGSTAEYSLVLERFSTRKESVPLHVEGLPAEIGRTFVDAESGARINEAVFIGGAVLRNVTLQVFLPDRASSAVGVDQSISFRVRAGVEGPDDVVAHLILVPRGVPGLELNAPNLFLTATENEECVAEITLLNSGSKRLDDVRIDVDVPSGWDFELVPEGVERLEAGDKSTLRLHLHSRKETVGGEYEVKLAARTRSDGRDVESRQKVFRLRLERSSPLLGSAVVGGLFLSVVAGVVALGVRVSRR